MIYILETLADATDIKPCQTTPGPGALVLLPTRELASQVSDQFNGKGGLRRDESDLSGTWIIQLVDVFRVYVPKHEYVWFFKADLPIHQSA